MNQKTRSVDLVGLRQKIDAIDEKLVRLIGERASAAALVGAWKRRHGLPVYDQKREAAVLSHVKTLNQSPGLPAASIQTIFASIIKECREYEETSHRIGLAPELKEFTISVIGLGLMGTSFVRALKAAKPDIRMIGYDPKPATKQAVDHLCSSARGALNADLIILALPVRAIIRLLKKEHAFFRPNSVILDFGSTKREICRTAWNVLPRDVTFIGGHPLAGKAVSGAANSDPRLFRCQPFVLVPELTARTRPPARLSALEIARQLVLAIGAVPVIMKPEQHDRCLAATSHLPQFLSVALALSARKLLKEDPILHGPAFLEMTRLAESDYRMWKDIASTNSDFLETALSAQMQELAKIRAAVAKTGFKTQFDEARRFRQAFTGSTNSRKKL